MLEHNHRLKSTWWLMGMLSCFTELISWSYNICLFCNLPHLMIIIQTKPYQLHTPKSTYTHMYMLHCNLGLIAFNVHSLVDKIFYKLYLENHKKINAPYLMTILHVVLYNHPSHKDPLFKMHLFYFWSNGWVLLWRLNSADIVYSCYLSRRNLQNLQKCKYV